MINQYVCVYNNLNAQMGKIKIAGLLLGTQKKNPSAIFYLPKNVALPYYL